MALKILYEYNNGPFLRKLIKQTSTFVTIWCFGVALKEVGSKRKNQQWDLTL